MLLIEDDPSIREPVPELGVRSPRDAPALPRRPALGARRAVVHGLASGLVNFLRGQQRNRLEMDGLTSVDS